MRRIARLANPGLLLAILLCASGAEKPHALPALVPADDPRAATDLLPAGISENTPELFGNYVHVWALPDGTQVLQYYGDFTLRLGQRRLRAQDAVIWMQKSIWQGQTYYHYQVYLSRDSEVRDTADTISTGPALFVTFNSTHPPVIEADVHTGKPSADTKLYEEAAKSRQAVLSGAPATQPGDWEPLVAGQGPGARPRTRLLVRHSARDEQYDERDGIITAIGDVYVSQGDASNSAEFVEIRADSAVLFLEPRPEGGQASRSPGGQDDPFHTEGQTPTPRDRQTGLGAVGGGFESDVIGAYLRGNVTLTRGERMIRASELYYDFENDRALILDAVMRALAPDRDIPIYVRAKEVRQLSATEYFARQAAISTSEFHTPHVHIGADRVYLTDLTPRDQSGAITGLQAGRYRAYDTTLNLEGIPIAYWPFSAGDFRQTQSPIQSVRTSYSDDFGATFQSKWYLYSLLGLEKPQGVEAILRLDYFSERGPGVGLDVDYETEDRYGMIRTYYVHDQGRDNLGPFRTSIPDTENRGRYTIRHREILPRGWELTLEASYISDPNFLEEYFNSEFEQGKEQETLIYLKKQQDNWAFTALAQWRVLDFLTQTEHLPDLGFQWIGEPLADIANFYTDSRVGWVRYRPDNRRVYDYEYRSDIVFRADTRNEIDVPIKLGDLNVVPFAMIRPSYWDDSPGQSSLGRLFGTAGARVGTQLWRVFEDARSRILDINGIRHIIRPQATGWASASNKDSIDLYPFDYGVESINDFYGSSFALRQVWQTKRGGPGQWRNVDWITFDVEVNLFGNTPHSPYAIGELYQLPIGRFYDYRPENSIPRNHIRTDFMYRISDTTAILSDTNFDLNDGSMDLLNISYAVERSPRFSYFIGYRRIGDTESNLLGGGVNYKINEKYSTAIRTYYDLDRGETEQFDIAIIRRWPRWYTALTFGLDNVENDIQLGFSIWPEGAPNAVIGSRQFTGLSESTGIRPEQ